MRSIVESRPCLSDKLDDCHRLCYAQSSRSSRDAFREGTFGSGASAVLPRGFAVRAGAALGIILFGTTAAGVGCFHWIGTGEGG